MSLNLIEMPAWLRSPETGFLSLEQKKMLSVLFEGILPADHGRQIPGASETGAPEFVSKLLAMGSDTYFEIPAWRTLYTHALEELDLYSRKTWQRPLAELDGGQITTMLMDMEAGTIPGLPQTVEQKLVFTTLRRHCIQGCFADPRWGGNKERMMWRALGYLQPAEDLFNE